MSPEIIEKARVYLEEHPEGVRQTDLLRHLGYARVSRTTLAALSTALPIYDEGDGIGLRMFLLPER